MELKSLEIKNIASIEHALIDFCAEPLRDESIFLICGETGAGKSTILDAICLALYNKAPRLDSAAGQEWIGDDAMPQEKRDPDGDLCTNDPRQFLRKGTAEASATLVFTGLDGIEYTAVWSVRRANRNIGRRIQNIEWTIKWGNEILDRHREVRAKVEHVTGMTFEQYCRTSMLAQGEFSRFLKSSENDKADILEKLTRTDIYARIGAGIARRAKEHREAYQRQQDRIAGIAVMEEEQRTQLQEELSAKDAALKELTGEKDAAALKLGWLRTLSDLEEKVKQSAGQVANARESVSSEKFMEDEKLCLDWDATSEQRAWLASKAEIEKTLERISGESAGLADTFARYSADLESKKTIISEMSSEYGKINARLESLQPYAGMYSSCRMICERLRDALSSRKTIVNLMEDRTKVGTALADRRKEYLSGVAEVEEMRRSRDMVQDELDALNRTIASLGKEEKARSRAELENRMSLVKDAGVAVRDMQRALSVLTGQRTMLDSYIKSCDEAVETAESARKAFDLADSGYAEALALVEKMKDSVDSWARVARSKLHIGDKCPLCGQTIESLTSDAGFEELLRPLKEDLLKKSSGRKAAESLMNDSIASLKACEKAVASGRMALARAESDYEQAKREAGDRCARILVTYEEDGLLDKLRTMYKALEADRDALVRSLDRIADLEKTAKGLQENINGRNKSIDTKDMELKTVSESVSSLEREMASLQAGIDSARSSAEVSMSLAGKDIAEEGWQERFNAAPEDFISSLEKESAQYAADLDKASSLAAEIEQKESVLKDMSVWRQKIAGILPGWQERPIAPVSGIETRWEDLPGNWSDLYTQVSTIKKLMESSGEALQKTDALLGDFYSSGMMSHERLEELASKTAEYIANVKKFVAEKKSVLKSAESMLSQRQEDLDRHRQTAPEILEEDTVDWLGLYVSQAESSLNDMNREIGAIRQRLMSDDENRKTAGLEREKAESLRLESERWDRLYRIFGDADGKKFKKIAQGYVMAELIRNANVYLDRLSGRYVLDSQPGSLTLTVRDMYQGGALRSVNTLSGGETFLVSLSLALGLSSLSKGSLKVNILFIDEGFGTLSSDYLNVVMESLENLHQIGGRKVGIISHVESLRERIPTQIQVLRQGSSSSHVRVVSAG